MDIGMYNSYAEIDLSAMKRNYEKIVKTVGEGVGMIPVLKANAYGHGTVEMARAMVQNLNVGVIAVSQPLEGIEIRNAGFWGIDILVMGGILPHQMRYALEYDLQVPVFTVEGAVALSAEAKRLSRVARVQIKIESGLNRIGIAPGDGLDELLDTISELGNIEVVGVFTHFSTATLESEPFTFVQHELFQKALDQMEPRRLPLKYIHCCNTGATSWFRQGYHTHVRVGCLVMGYGSMDDFSNPLGVEEMLSFRAFITHIHDIQPGESCGYNRHFLADKPTTVATINIGYGDGIYRPMAQSGGPVLVGDTRTRYLATCMDQSFIDVTGIDCRVGDEVTIYGRSRGGAELSFCEIEQITGQTLVYPMVAIGNRVKRIYTY